MTLPVLVIGAGPAGLAVSRELITRGIEHLVVERGDTIGFCWTRLYDSLVLHTGKHLSTLPGMSFDSQVPLFPSRDEFIDYLRRYAERFRLPIETGREVTGVTRENGAWRVATSRGDLLAGSLVVATGVISSPSVPTFEGLSGFRGGVRHSVDYRRPDAFVGKRTLVVGVGNSGGEIAPELARAGALVTIAVRSGASPLPREVFGVPIQYLAAALTMVPQFVRTGLASIVGLISGRARGSAVLPRAVRKSCANIPLIGFHLPDAIRDGRVRLRPGIEAFTPDGVRFTDGRIEEFDEVILATGYRAAIEPFGPAIRHDACGFGLRSGRVRSAQQPDVYFVGHNTDTRGMLYTIGVDARLVAKSIADGRWR